MVDNTQALSTGALVRKRIQDWFQATGGGGLVLPSGWFGRPHDNIHTLTDASSTYETLTLVLDSTIKLYFSQLPTVLTNGSELELRFSELRFQWQEYGSTKTHEQNFQSGLVRFIAS